MWQQWFASPGFRYATGDRLTMLKFAAADRTGMTDEQRRAEIVAWLERSRQPGFDDWLADQVVDATRRAAIDLRLELDHRTDQFALERSALAAHEANLRAELVQRGAAEREANDRAAQAISELFSVEASRTWRIRNRLVRIPPLSWISRG